MSAVDEKLSPVHDELANDGRGGPKRNRMIPNDEEDDDDDKPGRERRKIEIKFIQDKSRRHITFSKRKAGIMKKVRVALFTSLTCLDSQLLSRRLTSCPFSLELKFSSWSSQRLVSFIPSPPPNFSPLSPKLRARTSSR